MKELEQKIIKWAEEKGIFEKATKTSQWDKSREELYELFEAIINNNQAQAKDGIGDIIVTLIVQAKMWNLNIQQCLEHAYNEIKDRKGKMVNGMFVKDEK